MIRVPRPPEGIVAYLRKLWCQWTHGGGTIERDAVGRINWRCARCGRWSDPVPLDEERRVVDRDLAEYAAKLRAAPSCRRCGSPMRPGQAIAQTYTGGAPDFPGDTTASTLSAGGPGRLIDCQKCPDCGHSVTMGE